jgi:hypothetical protein
MAQLVLACDLVMQTRRDELKPILLTTAKHRHERLACTEV